MNLVRLAVLSVWCRDGGRHAIAVAFCTLSAVLLSGIDASGAPLRTLVRAGDLATDGSRLTAIEGLASVRGHVVFDAQTDAIVRVPSSGAPVALVRAGDPLPSPIPGTIETIGAVTVTPDGTVVFSAGLDSPAGTSALLAIDEAGSRVLVFGVGSPNSLAVNPARDVVMRRGATRLQLWRRATGDTFTIAIRRRTGVHDGRLDGIGAQPGLSDDGTVVFLASVRSSAPGRLSFSLRALRWRLDTGLEELASGAAVRRVPPSALSLARVAINRRGDVVEILGSDSATGVFVHPADGSPAYRVARPGDVVDGVALDAPEPGLLAIDDQLRIAFLGRFGAMRRVVLAENGTLRALTGDIGPAPITGAARLPADNAVAWTSNATLDLQNGQSVVSLGPRTAQPLGRGFGAVGAPSLDEAADAVIEMDRRSVYMATHRGALPLVRAGDAVEDAPPIAMLQGQQGNTGGDLSLLATLADGSRALLVRKGETLRRLVTDADPSPLGVVELSDLPPHDVGARHIALVLTTILPDGLLAQVLFDRTPRGELRAVASDMDESSATAQFANLDTPVALRDGIAFSSVVVDPESGAQTSGLFFARRGKVTAIATPGDRAPGSPARRISGIGTLVGTTRDAVFQAVLDEPPDRAAFFSWRPGRGLRRLNSPDADPQALSISPFVAAPPFVVGFEPAGEKTPGRLLILGPRSKTVLARNGDPSPLGGSLVIGDGLVRTRRGVAFLASREEDDTLAESIVEVPLPTTPSSQRSAPPRRRALRRADR